MVQLFNALVIGLFFWGIASFILFSCGCIYFIRGRENYKENEKLIMYGLSGLFTCFSISIIFSILIQSLNGELFYYIGGFAYSDNIYLYSFYLILVKLRYSFFISGMLSLIYPVEKYVKKTKFIFTLVNVSFLIAIILGGHEFIIYLFGYIRLFNIIIVYFILIQLMKRIDFEFKSIICLVLLGYVLIIAGFLLYDDEIYSINLYFYILPPFVLIIGSTIAITPLVIEPKKYSNIQKLWLYLGIIIPLALGTFIVLTFIISNNFNLLLNSIVLLMILSFAFYHVIIITRTNYDFTSKISLNVLNMFTKPPQFSEEDSIFYKTRQLWIVCKGPAIKYVYICPKCKSPYCGKCSRTLSNLENECWVCNSPIDEFKSHRDMKNEIKNVNSFLELQHKMKLFSKQKTLKQIFDDNVVEDKLESLEKVNLTLIVSDDLVDIEHFGMNQKDTKKFIKELLYFSPNERKEILKEISEILKEN